MSSKALIYRLNDDVLSTVFMFNARLRIDVQHPHLPSRTTRATSQVSHKWRRLALSLPSLWAASLDTDDPIAWIEVVLARAGKAPITVVIPSFSSELGPNRENAQHLDKFSNLAEVIMFGRYFPRTTRENITALAISLAPASLQFYAYIENVQWEDLLQSLARPAPHLETLALIIDHKWFPEVDGEQVDLLEHYLLPETLFNGHAPCLRKLDLKGCTFSLSWPILQNLTELRVSDVEHEDLVPVQEWLSLLSNLFALEILALRDAILEGGRRIAIVQSSTSRVTLPHLKLLKLAASNETICTMLTDLDFPVSCSMFISFSNPRNAAHFPLTTTNSQSILPHLTRAFVSNHIFMWHRNGQLISINSSDFNPREGPNIMAFDWPDRRNDEDNDTMHSVLTSLVSYGTVTDLHLTHTSCGYFSRPMSWGILEAMLLLDNNKLETLHIYSWWTRGTWIKILDMIENTHTTTGEVLFPGLRSLHFDEFSFNKVSKNPVSRLVEFISWRTRLGHGIQSVKFTKCGGVKNKLHKLTCAGVAVDWDGEKFPMKFMCRGPSYVSDPDSDDEQDAS
jgi:hypothetical protein